ncbi:hypothetical protein BGW42_006446 [Actinomortierella wolfii]|nr:hypothetical protein BGW42_006446 [Actinomortierella wolfii]
MNTRLPPEYAGELFFKADVENMPYPILPPEGAVDLLTKACTMLGQVRFDWAYIDRPKEGSVFIVMLNGDEVPHDGFQYMDDEVTYNFTSETGKVPNVLTRESANMRMIIQERQQGFVPGDQFTHIARRRYKLVNIGKDNIVLLHYTRADESRKVVADPRMAKTPPRNYPLKPLPSVAGAPGQPMAYPQQQPGIPGYRPPFPAQQQPQPQIPQQMKSPAGINAVRGGSPYAASPVAPGSPGAAAAGQQAGYGRFQAGMPQQVPGQPIQQPPQPTGGQQRLASINGGRKQIHKKQPNPQATLQAQLQHQQMLAQQQEDAEEPSGDELDFLTTRDVAIARYKRNHDYMAEVFSPYPASAIIPNQYDYQQSIEFFKNLQSKHGDDLDELKQEHDEKIKRFKAEAEVFYRGMLELKQATTVQEVTTANERVENFVGAKVLPYSFLRRTELPPDEASKTPEMRAKPAPAAPVPIIPPVSSTVDSVVVPQPGPAGAAVVPSPAAASGLASDAVTRVSTDNAIPATGTTEASTIAASGMPAASIPHTATIPTTTAAAVAEPTSMEIDSKPQESSGNLLGAESSNMQVDSIPPSTSSTVLETNGIAPVSAPSITTADSSSEAISTITHGEDHVMTEAPAPTPVPVPVPVPAAAPAPVPIPEIDAKVEAEPAATATTYPAPESISKAGIEPSPTSALVTNEVASDLSTTAEVPAPRAMAAQLLQETVTTENPASGAIGQGEEVANSTKPEASIVSQPTLPVTSAAEAPAGTGDPPLSGAVTTTASEGERQGGMDQINLPTVDHAPAPPAPAPPAPAPAPTLTPGHESLPVSNVTAEPVHESLQGPPGLAAGWTASPSTMNLAAAGGGDSSLDAAPAADNIAATSAPVVPAATMYTQEAKPALPVVEAPPTTEATVEAMLTPVVSTEVVSDGQPQTGDPAQ